MSDGFRTRIGRAGRAIRWFVVLAILPTASWTESLSGISSTGIYYEASGAGAPIVLIHGFSLDRRTWQPQLSQFEQRFRVIRYDLRGHGESAAIGAAYSPVEDLRSVLDALGLQRATLIGLSAGAEIAVDFALVYPTRVTRLVLASPGLGGYTPRAPLTWMQPVFQAAAVGEARRAATLWADTPIVSVRAESGSAALVREIIMSNWRLWSYKTNPAQRLAPPATQRLQQISCPTLIILGERDLPHIAEIAQLLVNGVNDATLVKLPSAGHLANLDAPEAFNQTLLAFLAR